MGWAASQHTHTLRRLLLLLVGALLSCSACMTRVADPSETGGASGVSRPSEGAGEPTAPSEMTNEPPAPAPLGWCDAQPVLARKCLRCHGEPPANGAPFALALYVDTQVVDARGKPRYERMRQAIESDLMPARFVTLEPPVEPLDERERADLLDWLGAGAPQGAAEACPETP